jgi:hypothetical protein
MAKQNSTSTEPIDCACVIHGTGYDWVYVDRLYNMLQRNIPQGIRMHVYTEANRPVPSHMIRHNLIDWPGISGPRKSWWYKLQLFDPRHHSGNMLYFDLDTVIVQDLTWIISHDSSYLWGIQDFKYLQNPHRQLLNSSVMWWNVSKFADVWHNFVSQDVATTIRRYAGDQDYIHAVLGNNRIRYFERTQIQSYRWQCLDGGYDFYRRCHRIPNAGVVILPNTSVLVFHGHPKPHEVTDTVIQQLWQ